MNGYVGVRSETTAMSSVRPLVLWCSVLYICTHRESCLPHNTCRTCIWNVLSAILQNYYYPTALTLQNYLYIYRIAAVVGSIKWDYCFVGQVLQFFDG